MTQKWKNRGRPRRKPRQCLSLILLCFVMRYPCLCFSRLHPKRVFQTVKNLNLMRQQRSPAPSSLNIPGSNQMSGFTSGRTSRTGTPCSNSLYGSETGSGIILDNKTGCILETPDDGYEQHDSAPNRLDLDHLG